MNKKKSNRAALAHKFGDRVVEPLPPPPTQLEQAKEALQMLEKNYDMYPPGLVEVPARTFDALHWLNTNTIRVQFSGGRELTVLRATKKGK